MAEKMVFVGGPRQVEKTTLSLDCLQIEEKQNKELCYYNWDNPKSRELLLTGEIPIQTQFLIFDEIHKYRDWRNVIKGFYDTYKNEKKILVTGSARLDYYRKGGDSLQGRYHYYRLHPFSVAEVVHSRDDLMHLLTFGGFPEPFLKASDRHYKRWQKERAARVLQDDLNGLEMIKEV